MTARINNNKNHNQISENSIRKQFIASHQYQPRTTIQNEPPEMLNWKSKIRGMFDLRASMVYLRSTTVDQRSTMADPALTMVDVRPTKVAYMLNHPNSNHQNI
jgi:hypothetical protein